MSPSAPTGTSGPGAEESDDRAARTGWVRRYLLWPPSHWRLVVMLVAALAVALLLQGFGRQQLGASSTRSQGRPVAGLESVGPVFRPTDGIARSVHPADRHVVLTFDDGPDPTWTPRVLEVLRRHQVRATFFVTGSQVVAHPRLVRALLEAGHEVGSHTFTHADLGSVSPVRANLELSLTQTALAGAAGVTTSLLRLPYSSVTAHMSSSDIDAARRAAALGYVIVAATHDGEDWRRPGVEQILESATPQEGEGAVIQLHDGGGERTQTVEALDRLIGSLESRGYTFATVSEVAGLPAGASTVPVTTVERLRGLLFVGVMRMSFAVTTLFGVVLVPIGVLVLLRGVVVLVIARRHTDERPELDEASLPAVSIVVPAFNEEAGIAASVRSLAASRYPELEVVVVDDGSTDRTAEIVAGLEEERVWLVRQANAGKPAALNLGVAVASHDLIVMVDGDTVFEPDTVRELVRPLGDPEVGAVSGNTKVGNRQGLLGRWQHVEYVMGFNLDRRMYDVLRCMPTVPGAVGAFRRRCLDAVGGVSGDTLAEDTDLTMAVHRAGWRVVYEPRARAWTEAPSSLGALWRQRYRWCYGTMQSMWKHRRAVREGTPLGRYGLPYLLLFQVLLPLLAPAVDLFAVYGLLFLDPAPVLAYWGGFNLVQLALGAYAFRLDGERLSPLWTVPVQQFVYRQLMYLVVIQSVISAAVGARLRWQKVHRTGDLRAAPGST